MGGAKARNCMCDDRNVTEREKRKRTIKKSPARSIGPTNAKEQVTDEGDATWMLAAPQMAPADWPTNTTAGRPGGGAQSSNATESKPELTTTQKKESSKKRKSSSSKEKRKEKVNWANLVRDERGDCVVV